MLSILHPIYWRSIISHNSAKAEWPMCCMKWTGWILRFINGCVSECVSVYLTKYSRSAVVGRSYQTQYFWIRVCKISYRLSVVWGWWGRVPVTGIYLTCLSLGCGDVNHDSTTQTHSHMVCMVCTAHQWEMSASRGQGKATGDVIVSGFLNMPDCFFNKSPSGLSEKLPDK